ncbi:hypothetical protein ACR9PT_08280 [Piscirickettsia salmonis]|uniref:hypothetical protein n=1 Tax=Piscirickettsia salmonis TaxID=1238 RepID=UPI003EB6AE2B
MLKACSVPTMQLHADYDTETETKKSHYSPLGDLRIQRFFDARPNIQKTALKRYFKKKLPSGIFSGKTQPDLPIYLQATMRTIGQENGSHAPHSTQHYVITGIIQSIQVSKDPGVAKELIDPNAQYIPYIGASHYHAQVKFKAELRQAGLIILTIPVSINLFEITASHLTVQQDSDKMAYLLKKAINQAIKTMYKKLHQQLPQQSTMTSIKKLSQINRLPP